MNQLDLSIYTRHPLGRVYDFIILRGRRDTAATSPDSVKSVGTTTSSIKAEPAEQPSVSQSPAQSIAK